MEEFTDRHLLDRWQAGDAESYAVLVSRYHGLVRGACLRQAAPGEDEDCLQAVFLILARRPQEAARAPALASWLLRTTWFVCEHSRRTARRRQQAERRAAASEVRDDHAKAGPEALDHLDACLQQLSEAQRNALTLHFLVGQSPVEVAASLRVKRAQAYLLISRGLANLRTLMAKRGMALAGAGVVSLFAAQARAATAMAPDSASLCTTVSAVAPSAAVAALADGATKAMTYVAILPYAVAAGLAIATVTMGSVLWAASDAPVPVPVSAIPAAEPATTKPAWAAASGMDAIGAWADLRVAGVSQRFRLLAPGTFSMGSPAEEKAADIASTGKPFDLVAGEVQHQVTISVGFWLADSACTQALWQAVTGTNPSRNPASLEYPVEGVSWGDCQKFLVALNASTADAGFRLPTSAQWEYACRAGSTTAFSFGPEIGPDQVNYDGSMPMGSVAKGLTRGRTVPVKSLPPNRWGLYEMHGNIWQWCSDWYGDASGSAERDPTGPASGAMRVLRGGCWMSSASDCRSAYRIGLPPTTSDGPLGLRLAIPALP
jgi:RNA polymerase sigma factor (sigma-70 family)